MINGTLVNPDGGRYSTAPPAAGGKTVGDSGKPPDGERRICAVKKPDDTICRRKRESKLGENISEQKIVDSDAIILNEAQLILAEKRTSLATMRTGIAVFAIPLSVLGLLIATSRYYNVTHVLHLIVPLGIVLAALIVLGTYLVLRALLQIRRYDRLILLLKRRHSRIAEFLN
jgi:hypothetical protein